MKFLRSVSVLTCCILVNSCGRLGGVFRGNNDAEKEFLTVPDIDDYRDPRSVGGTATEAAKAVVRIHTYDGAAGTGFFISKSGLLMTNMHVVGDGNCVREGCFVEIDREYEAGKEFKESSIVFFKPLRASLRFDAAIYQLYKTDKGRVGDKYRVTDVISLETPGRKQLIGKNLRIIGHPHGKLKKVKDIKASHIEGEYVVLEKFVLGGNSGSPALNEEGKAVAILHSGTNGLENTSRRGVRGQVVVSTLADTFSSWGLNVGNLENIFADQSIEELPKASQILVEDPEKVQSFHLGRYLALHKFSDKFSSDQTEKAWKNLSDRSFSTCFNYGMAPAPRLSGFVQDCGFPSRAWKCGSDASRFGYCPGVAETLKWSDAFATRADKFFDIKQQRYGLRSLALSARTKNPSGGALFKVDLRDLLNKARDRKGFDWDFHVAQSYAKSAIVVSDLTVEGRNLVDFFRNYRDTSGYDLHFAEIAESLMHIYLIKGMDREDARSIILQILGEENITLDNHLEIEELAFLLGVLK